MPDSCSYRSIKWETVKQNKTWHIISNPYLKRLQYIFTTLVVVLALSQCPINCLNLQGNVVKIILLGWIVWWEKQSIDASTYTYQFSGYSFHGNWAHKRRDTTSVWYGKRLPPEVDGNYMGRFWPNATLLCAIVWPVSISHRDWLRFAGFVWWCVTDWKQLILSVSYAECYLQLEIGLAPLSHFWERHSMS